MVREELGVELALEPSVDVGDGVTALLGASLAVSELLVVGVSVDVGVGLAVTLPEGEMARILWLEKSGGGGGWGGRGGGQRTSPVVTLPLNVL